MKMTDCTIRGEVPFSAACAECVELNTVSICCTSTFKRVKMNLL